MDTNGEKLDDSIKSAKEYLIWLLSRRDYARSKLKEKLTARGLSHEEAENLLKEVEAKGYYDEIRYQKQRIKQFLRRGHGAALIKAKLKVEKISVNQEDFSEAHHHLGTSPLMLLKTLALKQLSKLEKKDLAPLELKSRLFRFLLSKGHSSADIQTVLREIL